MRYCLFRKDLRGTSYPEDKDVVTARSVRVIYNFLRYYPKYGAVFPDIEASSSTLQCKFPPFHVKSVHLSVNLPDVYDCFLRAKDVLFNTVDALMTETQAKSFPEISQSLWFERKWSSLYEAFQDGRIDETRLRKVFAEYRPEPDAGKWLWIGIDASSIARPEAVTSADRTTQYMHNLPECKKPITFGWQFSTVVALPEPSSSWTYILDQQRVTSETTAIEVAEAQLARLISQVPANTIVVLDRGYDATWLWCRCSGLWVGILGRLKSNRCLYRAVPPPTGKKGAPRKDGATLLLLCIII